MDRKRLNSSGLDVMPAPVIGHHGFGSKPSKHVNLFLDAPASVVEDSRQRLVFDIVPSQTHAQAKPPAR